MPRAIADSDDESDDVDFVAGEKVDGEDVALATGSNETNEEGALQSHDGTNDRSTGSTGTTLKSRNPFSTTDLLFVERLKRQMLSAERKLLTNSAPVAMSAGLQSSTSPSMQAHKRRHTSAFASEPGAGPDPKAKRTKTMKTYGASRRQTQVNEDGIFERLREEGAPDPATSQSGRFTEHSTFNSSVELPAGLIQAEFVNHEPNVMFRDSGSTIADNSSTQQRLLEQALSSKKGLSTSVVNPAGPDEPKSSSLPFSASEQTRSVKSTGRQPTDAPEEDAGTNDANNDGVRNAGPDEVPKDDDQNSFEATNGQLNETADSHPPTQKPSPGVSTGPHLNSLSIPQASPAVEIQCEGNSATAASTKGTASTQKSTRGRKRKAEAENTDPLNSDDKAIGLPKERYQPRPSRRRATTVVEEPIDFSVRPERAAKAKRTKTASAKTSFVTTEPEQAQSAGATLNTGSMDTEKSAKRSNDTPNSDKQSEDGSQRAEDLKSQQPQSSQHTDSVAPPVEQKSDNTIFVKPAVPTPKAKSSSKIKRSQTTIFEDHVEFTSSQRSPSLRQQQNKRKSALQDVENEATKPSQKKRKTVVEEEDDDEDELAKDDVEDLPKEADTAPTKRGRGRPQKPTAKPKAKSAEKVLDDSEVDEDDPPELEEAPKKRGRGRPSKTAAESQSKTNTDHETNESTEDRQRTQSPSRKVNAEPPTMPKEAVAPASKPKVPTQDNMTPSPSPEKSSEKASAATPQKAAKTDPTQHSPIKSVKGSTMVSYRVGLSKRSRIPPLLRTMKPPKR